MNYTKMDEEKLIDLNSYNPNEEKVENVSHKMPCPYWISFTWIGLIFLFLYLYIKSGNEIFGNICLVIYLFYVFSQFFVIFFGYNQFFLNRIDGIEETMKELFSDGPKIEITVTCYHNVSTDDGGFEKVTYKEIFNFDYYSWKDISGIFRLESNEAKKKKYPFILLEIDHDIYFADSMSIDDLNQMKEELIKKNKDRDKNIRITVNKIIPGLEKFNLICIDPKNVPCFDFNITLFYTFIFIPPLCEFYKIYLDCHYYCQTFKIRKVISTRNNLNNDEKYNFGD